MNSPRVRTCTAVAALALLSGQPLLAAEDHALKHAARAYRDMQQLCASLPAEARDACVHDTRERYRDEVAEVRLTALAPEHPPQPFQ